MADVGITVSDRLGNYGSLISLMLAISVATAFTVAGVNHSCVKTSAVAELTLRVDLPNTSPSTRASLFPGLLIRVLTISSDSPQHKLYKIHNLTDEEATLIEPAACAIHGLDKLNPPVGIDVLLLGAGPTGLILAQLLKLNFYLSPPIPIAHPRARGCRLHCRAG